MVTLTINIPDRAYERLQALSDDSAETLDAAVVLAIDVAYEHSSHAGRSRSEVEDERRRIREALKDITTSFNWDEFHRGFGHAPMSEEERKAVLETLPILDPPMSHMIIEDREDRI